MYVKCKYNTQTLIIESVEIVTNYSGVMPSTGGGFLYSEINNIPNQNLGNLLSNPSYYKNNGSGALVLIANAPNPLPGRKIANSDWNNSIPLALDRANTVKGFATF